MDTVINKNTIDREANIKNKVTKVQLITNFVTLNQAKHGQETQQSLTINSTGSVTLIRYFWTTENQAKTRRTRISTDTAKNIISMLESCLETIKPICYLLERGTANIVLTKNGAIKHARVYLDDEIFINGINVSEYIKEAINLPEAKVLDNIS